MMTVYHTQQPTFCLYSLSIILFNVQREGCMKKRILTLFAFSTFLSASLYSLPAHSASFDCNKASSTVENLICTSPILSKQDEKMAKQYNDDLAKAKRNGSDAVNRVRSEQLKWLTFQRNTCQDESCLMREYEERLGCQVDCGNDRGRGDLVDDEAFGNFVGSSETHTLDGKVTNKVSNNEAPIKNNRLHIMKVNERPYLAVIDMWLDFANGHTCSVDETLARWAQNHWVIRSVYNGVSTELRFYPDTQEGKTQILVRDLNNQYAKVNCGMRGYFDGQIFERQ